MTARLRIAIYENLPLGGARRASYELGRHLAATHDVDLYRLTSFDGTGMDLAPVVRHAFTYRFAPLFGMLGKRLERGRLAPRSYTLFGPLRRLHRQIAADIRKGGYDVVLAHTDGMTQSPYLLRWLGDLPNVYFCEEVLRVGTEKAVLEQHRSNLAQAGAVIGSIRKLEDVWVVRRLKAEDATNVASAGTIVVNSRYSREKVWAAYGRESLVCYLGVDPVRFSPDRTPARDHEVLSIGAPIATKGHASVVDAIGRMPAAARPRLRVIAPRPAGLPALVQLAEDRGVDLITEIDVDEDSLVRRYRHATATVCAARLEPFGLTALESMACGTPVIAYREGGYQESVVDGETGLLVEPDAEALCEALSRICGDDAFARCLGIQARKRIEEGWTWDQSASRLEGILRSAAGG